MSVFVVTCEQLFANHFDVIAVCAQREVAEAMCAGEASYRIREMPLTEVTDLSRINRVPLSKILGKLN